MSRVPRSRSTNTQFPPIYRLLSSFNQLSSVKGILAVGYLLAYNIYQTFVVIIILVLHNHSINAGALCLGTFVSSFPVQAAPGPAQAQGRF
jgi:hypothetical protein